MHKKQQSYYKQQGSKRGTTGTFIRKIITLAHPKNL